MRAGNATDTDQGQETWMTVVVTGASQGIGAPNLLAQAPSIERIDMLCSKLP